jgi:putrescine aminotransferase
MKFAFLVHPLSADSVGSMNLDRAGALRQHWGVNPLAVARLLHDSINRGRELRHERVPPEPRLFDEMNVISITGAAAEGRIYEIPMDARAILDDPDQAVGFMETAVDMAIRWGARIVGLGSMTGIVGGRGLHLAEHKPVAITTGNSLTVYAALQNLYRATSTAHIDLSKETVAVVGVPGSIASAAAVMLAPQCDRLLLVGRSASGPARKLAEQLNAELVLDINVALSQARIIISATSTGSCIEQSHLLPGSVVVDVGVPTDVRGESAQRHDVLILTGGMCHVPEPTPITSTLLWLQNGMSPSCLAETMTLALDNRAENFSIGRSLDPDAIQAIGAVAAGHGFDFSQLTSFGVPLDDARLVRFQKARTRQGGLHARSTGIVERTLRSGAAAAEKYTRFLNPVVGKTGIPNGLVRTFVRGQGSMVFDDKGRGYLDFVAGFGSLNVGHNHPAVLAAVNDALRLQAPGFVQAAVNPLPAALAELLIAAAPSKLEMVFYANSGTEANEAALKLARASSGRNEYLSCEKGYHGKTFGSLSVSGNNEYRRPFEPLLTGTSTVPYGDLAALERELVTRRFAAFIVEPLQAEGGMISPPPGYLRQAQAICQKTGTLFIVDEVQTGLGRTGAMFAVEHDDVNPDILTLAKSLGGGLMPIGAMLCRRDLWMQAYGSIQKFALHTSTFGGGSLACAAGLATLGVLVEQDLPAAAAERGRQLYDGLSQIVRRRTCVREVRGQGLLLGVEFEPLSASFQNHWKASDRSGLSAALGPDADKLVSSFHVLHAMQTLLHGHGIYTQSARSNPLVLRVQPPLTITAGEVDRFLIAFDQTCEEIDYSTSVVGTMISKTNIAEHDAMDRPSVPVVNAAPVLAPGSHPSYSS